MATKKLAYKKSMQILEISAGPHKDGTKFPENLLCQVHWKKEGECSRGPCAGCGVSIRRSVIWNVLVGESVRLMVQKSGETVDMVN